MAGCSLAFHEIEKDAVFVAEGAHHVEGEGELGSFGRRATSEADDSGFHEVADGALVGEGGDDFATLEGAGGEFTRVDDGLEEIGSALCGEGFRSLPCLEKTRVL